MNSASSVPPSVPPTQQPVTTSLLPITFDSQGGFLKVGNDKYKISIIIEDQEFNNISTNDLNLITNNISELFRRIGYQYSDLDGVIISRTEIRKNQDHVAVSEIQGRNLFSVVDRVVSVANKMPTRTSSNPTTNLPNVSPPPSKINAKTEATKTDEDTTAKIIPMEKSDQPSPAPPIQRKTSTQEETGVEDFVISAKSPEKTPNPFKFAEEEPLDLENVDIQSVPSQTKKTEIKPIESDTDVVISAKPQLSERKWYQINAKKLKESFQKLKAWIQQSISSISFPKFSIPKFWKTQNDQVSLAATTDVVKDKALLGTFAELPAGVEPPSKLPDKTKVTLGAASPEYVEISIEEVVRQNLIEPVNLPSIEPTLDELINELEIIDRELSEGKKAKIIEGKLEFLERARGITASKNVGTSEKSKEAIHFILEKIKLSTDFLKKLDPQSEDYKE